MNLLDIKTIKETNTRRFEDTFKSVLLLPGSTRDFDMSDSLLLYMDPASI
jgi:hypothetical protein